MKEFRFLLVYFYVFCLYLRFLASHPTKPSRWMIEIKSHASSVHLENELTNAGICFETHVSYEGVLFHGLSISLINSSDIHTIQKLDIVHSTWPVSMHANPHSRNSIKIGSIRDADVEKNQPLMWQTHEMTGISKIYDGIPQLIPPNYRENLDSNQSNGNLFVLFNKTYYPGTGIKVGIIDSGIDYSHPSLGGCFGKGCRVATGYDFVGDAYDADGTPHTDSNGRYLDPRIPAPKSDPKDCSGHGTHVASIVGGMDSKIFGVAPNVTFGAYKVFGCDGGTSSDVLVQAMERAFMDGMNIINLSVGGSTGWGETPETMAAARLIKNGVLVVASIGNDGKEGLWETSSPSIQDSVISVAASENKYFLGGSFLTNTGRNISFSGVDDVGSLNNASITAVKTNACSTLPINSLNGTIALIVRGGCSVSKKARNAAAAGAIGVFVYNFPNAELFVFTVEKANDGNVSIFGLNRADGEFLISDLNRGSVEVSFNDGLQVFENEKMGLVADYSSWGPGPNLEFKPDIMAPGSFVYGAYTNGSYATLSGTSMSSPYITGVLALLLQRFGSRITKLVLDSDLDSFGPRSRPDFNISTTLANVILQSTSKRPFESHNFLHPASAGAGSVRPYSAITTKHVLIPSSVSLGETSAAVNITLNLVSLFGLDSNLIHTYTVSHNSTTSLDLMKAVPTNSTSFPFKSAISHLNTTVKFYKSTLTPQTFANTTTTLNIVDSAIIQITPPEVSSSEVIMFGGEIIATPNSPDAVTLRASYIGVVGDTARIPILPTNGSYPFFMYNGQQIFGTLSSESLRPRTGPSIQVNLSGNNVLQFVFSLTRPVLRLEMLLLQSTILRTNSSGVKVWKYFATIERKDKLPKNDGSKPFDSISWNGTITSTGTGCSGTVTENGNRVYVDGEFGLGCTSSVRQRLVSGVYKILVRFKIPTFGKMGAVENDYSVNWLSPELFITL